MGNHFLGCDMPEKFKQTLNLSVGIPVWGVLSTICILIFQAGATISKLNTLIDSDTKTKVQVEAIAKTQNERTGLFGSLQLQIQSLESRVAFLERKK